MSEDAKTAMYEAVLAAGGASALARKLGIKQPSVAGWNRVPAERVLEVERLSGVPKERLRPDLYRPQTEAAE
jgi:DNA-binding transcriptional regulator YdaS (Cro superfamily)